MGFFISGTMLGNRPAEKKEMKARMKAIQKAIVELNKAIEIIAQYEQEYLKEAAIELEEASKFGGRYESTHLKRMETAQERANYFKSLRLHLLEQMVYVESCKKKEIEALQDGDFTTQKTRRFCFFF